MNAREFFAVVAMMREVQKEYFKTRDQQKLLESKRLEKAIDDEIKRVNDIMARKEVRND